LTLVKIVKLIDQMCSAHANSFKKEGLLFNTRFEISLVRHEYFCKLYLKNWVNVAELCLLYFPNNLVLLFYRDIFSRRKRYMDYVYR